MVEVCASKEARVKIIKETHHNLRKKLAASKDFDKVWKLHCSEDDLLKQYSIAMQELATTDWSFNCDGTDRTSWCRDISIDYFFNGGFRKFLEKDERRKKFYALDKKNFLSGLGSKTTCDEETSIEIPKGFPTNNDFKIKLLDVGSCYNPFATYPEFDTVAIDLFPANRTVVKCDFLSVNVDLDVSLDKCIESVKFSSDVFCLLKLPAAYFHVVVFSLLLSYIPCPHSRWLMCEKAHQVLCVYGLLLIITPDSSHQNKHSALMKNWKYSIESIGFQRIKYVKDRHMHFLAFRKVSSDHIWDKRKDKEQERHFTTMNILNIPQDFNDREMISF